MAEIECENNDRKCEGEFTVIKGTGENTTRKTYSSVTERGD